MRGGASTENEGGAEVHEESTDTEGVLTERRPSIVALQNMLKKVSQSPFHNQYKSLVPSASDSSGSSLNESRNNLDGEPPAHVATDAAHHHPGEQSGVQELLQASRTSGDGNGLASAYPFYAYHLESRNGADNAAQETSKVGDLDTIFVPPPEFQSSTLDSQPDIETVGSGAVFSEPPGDLLQAFAQDPFLTSSTQSVPTDGVYRSVTLSSPDYIGADVSQTQSFSETVLSNGSDRFHGENLLEDSWRHAGPTEDIFKPLPPQDPFQPLQTTDSDLFLFHKTKQDLPVTENFGRGPSEDLDVFSPSPAKTVDPFQSPLQRDLFQDVSPLDDVFGSSKPHDPFQPSANGSANIFRPLRSSKPVNGGDIFAVTLGNAFSEAAFSTPSPSGAAGAKPEAFSTPDLFKTAEPPSAGQPVPSKRSNELLLTTPQGTKHDLLQPTPFSQASSLSAPPNRSPEMTHVTTFRRPPKPLPRSRPPRPPPKPAKPAVPEPSTPKTSPKPAFRPLPKPVLHHKPKAQESKPVEAENFVVFEDILLIGQEKCVEDWPEDSPQLSPDFKPTGKFRLRRESFTVKAESDGRSGDDHSGAHKKKDRKFRVPLLPRMSSKDKFPDDTKEGRSRTLPIPRKKSKDYVAEMQLSSEEIDEENLGFDRKKKPLKAKVTQLLRRASTSSFIPEGKHANKHLETKDGGGNKKTFGKKDSNIRRWSEGMTLDDGDSEDAAEGRASHEEKAKKKMGIKFVPHRPLAMGLEKEPKGAHGYTPRKDSKDKSQEEFFYGGRGAYRKKSQEYIFEDVEELKRQAHHSSSKASFMDDDMQKPQPTSVGFSSGEDACSVEDCKPKRTKMKLLSHGSRRSSEEDMLEDTFTKKGSCSADELDDADWNDLEDCKPKTLKRPVPPPRKPTHTRGGDPFEVSHCSPHMADDGFDEDDMMPSGKDFPGAGEMYDSEEEEEEDELDSCKPQKKSSKLKGLRKYKAKSKLRDVPLEEEDPPGAASSDFLSEAAKAEWLAAQKDERAMAGLEDMEGDGDTDSLMEWWYTVEQWDEVPSDDEEKVIQEDESKSFSILADKVHQGLRLFNKVFTERAEVLWQSIIRMHAIADDISTYHQKAKIAGITGGTTTAVGGVTAIAGLVMAPFTLGASLIVTAVGVGVATAGGITSASAAISDNVNNMHDRKKVETVLQEYEDHLLDIGKILHFVNHGMYKLRGHPFLRSGTQHYAEDWEIRRAVQMISMADSPVQRATDITDHALASVQGLFKGMDKYFVKDSRELKSGCRKEIVAQIKEVANVLNDGIVDLNAIREELQDTMGNA